MAGQSLGGLLDVQVGDVVTVSAGGDGTSTVRLPIEGFVDEPLGTLVYVDPSTAESLIDPTRPTTVMVRYADGADREDMRRTITRSRTLAVAAVAVLAVSVLTQWPASRMISRLDLATVVRERSQ